MKTISHTLLGRSRMCSFLTPSKLPGINFDTFEEEVDKEDEVYGTDRMHPYHPRLGQEHPRHYVHRYSHRTPGLFFLVPNAR